MQKTDVYKIRNMLGSIAEYIFATILILDCRTMYGYMNNNSYSSVTMLLAISVSCILLTVYITKNGVNNIGRYIVYIIIITIYVMVYAFFQNVGRNVLFNMYFFTLACLYLATMVGKKVLYRIASKYVTILSWIALISIMMWLFGSILGIIHPSSVVYSRWSVSGHLLVNTYHYLYFEPQKIDLFGISIWRNSAIFTEAPMAALNFAIALGLETLILDKKRKWCINILAIAIITTFSSTGILYLIFVFLYKKLSSDSKSKYIKLIKILSIPCILFFMVYIIINIINQKMTYNSGLFRIDDYIAIFRTWMDHFFIGTGLENDLSISKYMNAWRIRVGQIGLSNSLVVLAEGGIYISLVYIVLFYTVLHTSLKNRDTDSVAFILLYIFLFTVCIFPYQYIFIFIMILVLPKLKIYSSNLKYSN